MIRGYHKRPGTTVPIEVARALRKRLTRQEAALWVRLRRLRPAGFGFRRQVPIGPYVVDFACLKARLVVEVDGGQHGLDAHAARDAVRDARLAERGFRVARFWNHQVDRDLDVVMDTIFARLTESRPSL
ncbi:endonuclease domain-containing protein [Salinarimonas chemoclinalis]|uniref:endonuclease domain-containing protein n=1 Tax=Salinarimonas chemoclinalis TaxID=3241599 RepID=UPI0035569D4E